MRLPLTPFLLLLPLVLPFLAEAQPLFPIKKNNKWGLMDAEGRLVQQPVYDAIGEFKQYGYAVMQRGGRVGILNSNGQEIVPPKYDDLKALDSTLITVMEEGRWKVVNLQGRVILHPGYERVEILSGSNGNKQASYLAFMANKRWGIVDGQGRIVAAPRYDEIFICANVPEEVPGIYFQTKLEGLFGLLLTSGLEVLAPQAEEIRVFNANLFFYKKYRKWGAVDAGGLSVIEAVYDHFSRISENFIKLTLDHKENLFSLIYNKLVSKGGHEAYYPFSTEYVLCKKQRSLGLIDHCGSEILSSKYNEIQAYDGDIFRANLNGRWGIVTLDDLVLIPFEYDYIAPMQGGLCVVIRDRKYGVANYRGQIVVKPAFDSIELGEGQAKAYMREKLSFFNFDAEGRLKDENNFEKHFTIKVKTGTDRQQQWSSDDSPYQLEKFEWFYSPKQDKWGLRRLDNGSIQIEPSFNEVKVEKELGLTLVGVETLQPVVFDRTAYRFEMAYGLVQNDTGLLVHEMDLVDVRLGDFADGLPVARCIFNDGKQGLVNRIGKIVRKDFSFIGEFHNGLARVSAKGKISATLDKKSLNLGLLQNYLSSHLAPVTLTDYTLHDLNMDKFGLLTCEGCAWGYVDTAGQLAVAPGYTFAKDFINEVGIVADGDKWGMVDRKGKQLLPCRYDELGFLENTGNKVLRVFKKEEKYGLIDTLGRLAVGVQYEQIGSFGEGRLAVKRQGNWGFVDRNGREVVPCRFDEVSTFSEGWAAVRIGSKWGYIDRNGNEELDFQFSKAGNFSNGLAPAKKEGPYFGYINRQGEWAVQPRFPRASDFDRGIARVEELSGEHLRVGLIDSLGNMLMKPKFVTLTPFDQYGLAVAGLGGNPMKYGLVNFRGEIITSQAYKSIEPFVDGMARVQGKDGSFGFVNTKGELVIPAQFSKTSNFSEGRAAVWLDGQCGFVDTLGNLVVAPQFSRCLDYKDGKAIVFKGNQKAGLIDNDGNFVIEPGVNRLLDFAEGRGLVRNEQYQFYYITEQSRFYDGFYEKASEFKHGVAVVQVEGRWAIINQQGIEIIPPKYDKIDQFENGFAKVRIKGFNGLTNLQGELIVQPDYEYISYAGEGLIRVEQGDKVGYFDMEGKWVWGLQE
ncbi:MAG: WG repeat-containing protein [Lewinellaceae bacterium]|nr:WG repeat-containing protein [Saprospiraceae bacterium]MCB9341470.1 WG repeat-containing protein [Lewinellaceae bacterium]